MTRQRNRLTARTAATTTEIGRHADGENLYLKVSKTGSTLSKRWVFFYTITGRQREAGLGSSATVTLAKAREKAAEFRSMLAKGSRPLDAKQAASAAAEARQTFGQCADALIKSKRSEWRNAEHARQWVSTLDVYFGLRNLTVDEIDTAAVLTVLQPIWSRIPETARRVRGRVEATLDYAKAHGMRSGENPARWRGHLALILPKRQKLSRGHHAAMPYADIPAFLARLREQTAMAAIALEFLILTAARSGEVLGAQWQEINLDAKVWTIPAARMKAAKEHRVPFPKAAVVIIKKLEEARTGAFLFPGQRRGKPLSATVLEMVLRRMKVEATPHGFRSAFRDWCGEETSFPREIAEQALAHATGGAVERAYRRGDALEKRRQLMEAWA